MQISKMAELLTVIPGHYEKLARYLTSFPNEKRDAAFWMERFRLWWDKNPAFGEGHERGWIVTEDNEIVGFLGNFPSYFQLSRTKIIVQNATTWRVSETHRNQSLQLLFKQIAYSQGTLLFMTTPNEAVAKVIRTLNYQKIGRTGRRMSFFTGASVNFLAKAMGGNLAARIPAAICGSLWDAAQNVRIRGGHSGGHFNAMEIFRADSSFDELWERVKGRYPNTYVRSSAFINWYCFGNRDFQKKLFGVYHDKRLIAFMIFINPPGRRWDFLECLDFFGEMDDSAAIAALIGYLRQYARNQALDFVKLPHFSSEVACLFKNLGLFQRESADREEYFKVNLSLTDPITENNSYFTHAVGDVGL